MIGEAVSAVKSLIEILMEVAPEMAPKIETAIDKFGQVHKVPTDEFIKVVRDSQEAGIDAQIDREVDDLDIPE